MTLYHYTCKHSLPGIYQAGEVRPNPVTGLAWFTDLDVPVRDALGLTSQILDCDRTQHRFIVADVPVQPVPYWAVRRALNPEYRAALESAPGAMLMHWWVSRLPVKVLL